MKKQNLCRNNTLAKFSKDSSKNYDIAIIRKLLHTSHRWNRFSVSWEAERFMQGAPAREAAVRDGGLKCRYVKHAHPAVMANRIRWDSLI